MQTDLNKVRLTPAEPILQAFAGCNPFWLAELQRDYPDQVWKEIVCNTKRWYGCSVKALPNVTQSETSIIPIYHVFPVVLPFSGKEVGLMAGVSVIPTPENEWWRLSDAFGRMEMGEDVFDTLFKYIEKSWKKMPYSNPYLPLRWRRPLDFRLLSPIHLDQIGGESMQVPLLLALLRASASNGRPNDLPFGPQPVFCTGRIGNNGVFQKIEGIVSKVQGFLREYGKGRPAILTRKQQNDLANTSDILDQIECHTADNITELMKLPVLNKSLLKMCNPPQPSEYDKLIQLMEMRKLSRHFDDVEKLATWLNPQTTLPYYRTKIALRLGQIHLHKGNYAHASLELTAVSRIIENNPDIFSIEDRIEWSSSMGTLMFDAGEPVRGLVLLKSIEKDIPHANHSGRACYWGILCQLYRATEEYKLAIHAGQMAVKAAKRGNLSEVHRDINYLVHAYIARARSDSTCRQSDLENALEWLIKSQRDYAPIEGSQARDIHNIFCWHLAAEHARLNEQPYELPHNQHTSGTWKHAYLFLYFSIVRNHANSLKRREAAIKMLLKISTQYCSENGGIFLLFDSIYNFYADYFRNEDQRPKTEKISEALTILEQNGLKGWKSRLESYIQDIENSVEYKLQIENLCDAVYFH